MAAQKTPPDAYAQALAMRLEGKTYREIGAAIGVTRQRAQSLIAPPTVIEDVVIARTQGCCEDCRAPAARSGHIHHRQARGMTPETYNAEPNLVLLCASCHRKAHRDHDAYIRRQQRNLPDARVARQVMAAYHRGAQKLGIAVEEYRQHREQAELWCGFHKTWESADLFGLSKGRCREGNREMVRQHQTAAYHRDYYLRNKERLANYQREWQQRRRVS